MLESGRVLAVVEPDDEVQPALDRAVRLAESAGRGLDLVLADYSPYLESGFYFDPVQAEKLRYEHGQARVGELEALARPLRERGLEVSCVAAWGNPPWAEIVGRVEDSAPALVVKTTRHHSRVSRLLLSNADWELVRHCPAPLLLVKERAWDAAPVFLAAVDPDHMHDKPASLDGRIIACARALAAVAGGEAHLFHSAWVPPLAGVYPLLADAGEENRKLKELAEAAGVDPSRCHWTDRNVVEALPEQARTLGASAVVMGAVSRSRLDRALVGNTAEKVLDRIGCDVLVVKPERRPG